MDGAAGLRLWVERLRLRSPLDATDRDRLLGFPGKVELVRANRDIVRMGEVLGASCLIIKGVAARYGQTRSGARQYTAFYIAGDMGDLHSAMLPHVGSPLVALSDTWVMRIPHQAILAATAASEAIAHACWRDCVVDASVAGEWLLNIAQRDAKTRLAHLLCELALRYEAVGSERLRYPMQLTQAHLGEALGLTAVHINRTLRALREAGLARIVTGEVHIADWAALVRAGDFDPTYLHLALQRTARD